MEKYNSKYSEYQRNVKLAHEELFRGLVWNDLGLIDSSLISLNKNLGKNRERVGLILMNLLIELEEDYWLKPHDRQRIIPEA